MNNGKFIINFKIRFKNHFKNLNFYSIPSSILFIVRKRLNFVFTFLIIIFFFVFSII